MHDCADLAIKHVWMHRGAGGGSVSETATAYGREHGITVIDGGCPCMFGPTSDPRSQGHARRADHQRQRPKTRLNQVWTAAAGPAQGRLARARPGPRASSTLRECEQRGSGGVTRYESRPEVGRRPRPRCGVCWC